MRAAESDPGHRADLDDYCRLLGFDRDLALFHLLVVSEVRAVDQAMAEHDEIRSQEESLNPALVRDAWESGYDPHDTVIYALASDEEDGLTKHELADIMAAVDLRDDFTPDDDLRSPAGRRQLHQVITDLAYLRTTTDIRSLSWPETPEQEPTVDGGS